MAVLSKVFAIFLWIPLIIWVGASEVFEKARGKHSPIEFIPGVTFSTIQAKRLNLDPEETYLAILDDLGAERLRLVAYWPEIEKLPGEYDFSQLDFQIKEAEKRNAKVILALGIKLPRWPECHLPQWVSGTSNSSKSQIPSKEFEALFFNYISRVVMRYKESSAISMWQVENEPFFKFGLCPQITLEFLKKEVEVVKLLDDRPILITDSGELSSWFSASRLGDVVGTTMYRRNLMKFGYITYPLPARYYEKKAALIKKFFGDNVLVIEMQAEPWMRSANLADFSPEEQFKGLDFERFKSHIAYAKASRLSPVYFWGVEWWYWLKKEGHPEFWNWAKENLWPKPKTEFEVTILPSPSPKALSFAKTLRPGMQDEEVVRLQAVLKKLGFFPESAPISGYFGPITEKAVQDFQKAHGIEPLGIVGPKTLKLLNEIVK
ncbi:MAG: peptidoglycan-binding protein [Candidatus Paceibacteria bacterium]